MQTKLAVFGSAISLGFLIGALRDSVLPWVVLMSFPGLVIALLWGGGDPDKGDFYESGLGDSD